RHLKERLRTNEAELARALAPASPLSALPGEGGWSVILRVPALFPDEGWALDLLERERVLVQPGFFFDLDQGTFLVVSLLPAEPADGTVVRFTLVDGHGDVQLRRTLPGMGRGRPVSDCLALAETIATIVERYLVSVPFQARETEAPPRVEPASAAPTVVVGEA